MCRGDENCRVAGGKYSSAGREGIRVSSKLLQTHSLVRRKVVNNEAESQCANTFLGISNLKKVEWLTARVAGDSGRCCDGSRHLLLRNS